MEETLLGCGAVGTSVCEAQQTGPWDKRLPRLRQLLNGPNAVRLSPEAGAKDQRRACSVLRQVRSDFELPHRFPGLLCDSHFLELFSVLGDQAAVLFRLEARLCVQQD